MIAGATSNILARLLSLILDNYIIILLVATIVFLFVCDVIIRSNEWSFRRGRSSSISGVVGENSRRKGLTLCEICKLIDNEDIRISLHGYQYLFAYAQRYRLDGSQYDVLLQYLVKHLLRFHIYEAQSLSSSGLSIDRTVEIIFNLSN